MINIVCVGQIKEEYYSKAIFEYVKRIGRYSKINITEVKEARLPANFSNNDILNVIKQEGIKIQQHLKGYVVICDVKGTKLDSVSFAKKLKAVEQNFSDITFVIGGSYGVWEELKNSANLLLSFSDFTLPHQLFRVLLTEQIYRALTINNNVTYHKWGKYE